MVVCILSTVNMTSISSVSYHVVEQNMFIFSFVSWLGQFETTNVIYCFSQDLCSPVRAETTSQATFGNSGSHWTLLRPERRPDEAG